MDGPAVNMHHKRRQKAKVTSSEQATSSLDGRTSQEEPVKIDVVEEPEASPSEHRANETQTDGREQTCDQVSTNDKIRDSLYLAARKGDWQSANDIYKKYPDVAIWYLPLTQQKMNALQVAVAAKQTAFVKQLLNCMEAEELEFENANGDTALLITALSGNVNIAKKMVEKNKNLPGIRNKEEHLPLLTAAMHRHKDMVLYLYRVTDFEELTPEERIKLFLYLIFCDSYDIAKEILSKDPTLAKAEDENGRIALKELARKAFAIGSRSQMSAWKRCIRPCFKGVYHKALMRTLAHQLVKEIWENVQKLPSEQFQKYSSTIFLAAKLGNVEFITILLESNPDLIWMVDKKKRNIFHISIRYRQESIFTLIHEIGVFKDMIATNCDIKSNNMLHLAGKLVDVDRLNIVPGATLHMQRELLWFKEVEKIVPLAFLKAKNYKGKTPKDLFTKTHEKLLKDNENWMRGTAMHCMLVATLIATVVFAAIFTVPGGNEQDEGKDGAISSYGKLGGTTAPASTPRPSSLGQQQEKGTPILFKHKWFLVFFISDSIALLSSSTAILNFLSILTARFTERDFVSSLPRKLMFGLTALFISILSMVVAFGATCFLVDQSKNEKVAKVIISLASFSICTCILVHYELWGHIINSTNLPRFLFRSRNRMFC